MNESFFGFVSALGAVTEMRELAGNKAGIIKSVVKISFRRLAKLFILEAPERKAWLDIIIRDDGFRKLIEKKCHIQIQRFNGGVFLVRIEYDLCSVRENKVVIARDEDGNFKNLETVPFIVRLARSHKMIKILTSGTYRNKQ